MELKEGYKQTDIGVIPEDWEVVMVEEVLSELTDYTANGSFAALKEAVTYYETPEHAILVRTADLGKSDFIPVRWTDKKGYDFLSKTALYGGELIMANVGSLGKIFRVPHAGTKMTLAPNTFLIKFKGEAYDESFAYHYMRSSQFQDSLAESIGVTTIQSINKGQFKRIGLLKPFLKEQQAIAEVLSDVDAEIELLARRYEKLVNRKQGLSEELLSGRTRLVEPKSKGFKQTDVGVIPEDWELTTIDASCSILDSQRIPLNSNERLSRQGIFPYCGANGILDFVDDFLIDDEVVLLAEDGGQFDEFKTRPICYHFKGKFWPNNHVHVLKGGAGLETKYLFFHFEHKDITPFINGGTRSKLNQGDMREIQFTLPPLAEQQAIAQVLSDMDAEIQAVGKLKAKVQAKKEGLMQTLLTGKIRLT